MLANSLYDLPYTRTRALKWLPRPAAGCDPLNSVVIKIGSCYAHGFGTPVNRLLAHDWFLVSAQGRELGSGFRAGQVEAGWIVRTRCPVVRALMWFTLAMAMTQDEELRERAQASRVELANVVPIEDGVNASDLG